MEPRTLTTNPESLCNFPLQRALDFAGDDPIKAAQDNKILPFYLAQKETPVTPCRVSLKEQQDRRIQQLRDSVAALARNLEDADTRWAIFKTFRPFPFNPTDIDIICFEDCGARTISDILMKRGYTPSGSAPRSMPDVRDQ